MIKTFRLTCAWFLATGLLMTRSVAADDWQPGKGPLTTPWTDKVRPDAVLPEHPRPQMVRDGWVNLNGLWDYAITPKDAERPKTFDGQILVPFPLESSLSGVMKPVRPEQRLWYRRTFDAPELEKGARMLLHFGAVDWQAEVFVNGRAVGSHQGGHDPFTIDITEALQPGGGKQHELVVGVWDPTDTASQPRGKQTLKPEGIFYTAVTGIWQTVWLEPVPAAYVASLKIVPDVPAGVVRVTVAAAGGATVELRATADGQPIASASGAPRQPIELPIRDARLWSPDDPFLYDLDVTLRAGDSTDTVRSYFGMRAIAISADAHRVTRLVLNGKALFQYGPLDQGWWPDGLYTAPTDEALRFDVETMKNLGFNMVRKHVKVEPARWYHWCDRLGLLVWQDMPGGMRAGSNDNVGGGQQNDADLPQPVREQFRRELGAMIDALHNHPSVVVWVPFNEGWGQHDTIDVLKWVKQRDPTRLVDGPSGWEDRGFGDLKDMHHYPGPGMFPVMSDRASVLGEFGGLGLPVAGHLWQDRDNWGYRTYRNADDLRHHYEQLILRLRLLARQGLAAAVYTQLTDVEGEVNGLLTYDRRIFKLDPDWLQTLHAPLYQPAGPITTAVIVPTSERSARPWRYTTTQPPGDWSAAEFDASSWETAPAPFGTAGTPGVRIGTTWNSPDIWLRRAFDLDRTDLAEPYLRVYHDEDATIYLNGEKVAELSDFTTDYVLVPLAPGAAGVLRKGTNVIAIHCRHTVGGQGIDAGLVDVRDENDATR